MPAERGEPGAALRAGVRLGERIVSVDGQLIQKGRTARAQVMALLVVVVVVLLLLLLLLLLVLTSLPQVMALLKTADGGQACSFELTQVRDCRSAGCARTAVQCHVSHTPPSTAQYSTVQRLLRLTSSSSF